MACPHIIPKWHGLVHRGFSNNPSCELGVRNYTQRLTSGKGTQPDHLRNARVDFSEHVLANYYHNRRLDYNGLVKLSHPSIPLIP